MTGRNDPCPCGSGRKFKKCCLDLGSGPDVGGLPWNRSHPVWQAFQRQEEDRESRRLAYGSVKDIISTEFKGQRVVAVGDRLYASSAFRTFPDFLFAYVKEALGSGWGENELRKPLGERHPVLQWYDHFCHAQAELKPGPDGVYSMEPDGICAAYLYLAYDLYVLRHHALLQEEVLRRLRRADQFRGARYELLVTATFIRAGFDIEFEDESDTSRKHPEFIAVHKESGFRMALEAKARNRHVATVLANPPNEPRVDSLLRNAAAKAGGIPYAVSVDVALPAEPASCVPSWIPKVQSELASVIDELEGENPFDLVFFTNVPHQYGESGEGDPARHYYAVWPESSRIPDVLVEALGAAFEQYGRVPSGFPRESFIDAV
jgi:hypothetical protein